MSSETELESLSSSQHSERLIVPQCLQWTVEEVADWIEALGFQQYRVRVSGMDIIIDYYDL